MESHWKPILVAILSEDEKSEHARLVTMLMKDFSDETDGFRRDTDEALQNRLLNASVSTLRDNLQETQVSELTLGCNP